jgi:signal transduction histidine kinase
MKVIIVWVLVLMCLLMAYYFHFVVKSQIIFTHVFYIPIVIASIYWKRTGIFIAVFLGVFLMVSQIISSLESTPFDLIRSLMFVAIAIVITFIINKNKEINIRLKQSEKYILLNKKLTGLNKQLQKAKRHVEKRESQLKESNATKDKLFSIIAHDLKSPFNSILGFSDLLIENHREYDNERIDSFLFNINSASKHTLVLLDNLLDWARLQIGQIIFRPENLFLKPIITDVIGLLNLSAKIKNISLNILQPDDFLVFADKNMLQTILRNLISNAVKFTYAGGKVDVIVISNQTKAEISVLDNGVGMSDEVKNNLFNIGVNDTKAGTAKEKGSGLGLLLCKEFVEKSGGEISVVSELGKGSEFKFTIPLG